MELANELIKMEESFRALMSEKENGIKEAIKKISTLRSDAAKQRKTEKAAPKTRPQINLNNSVLRQDFIVGQVEEIGQKDKLLCVSLICQIEARTEKKMYRKGSDPSHHQFHIPGLKHKKVIWRDHMIVFHWHVSGRYCDHIFRRVM